MTTRLSLWLACAFVGLAAGAQAADPRPPAAAPTRPITAGVNIPADTRPNSNAYKLTTGDVIEIKVYDEKDLDAHVRISDDGSVTLPLLGNVKLGGLTDRQAQTQIQKLLGEDFLVNPQVTLTVSEPVKRTFTVIGEVRTPNVYEIPFGQRVDVVQAIARAGGYTPIANQKQVVVSRLIDNRRVTSTVDAAAMARNPNTAVFEILPGDTIHVKERIF